MLTFIQAVKWLPVLLWQHSVSLTDFTDILTAPSPSQVMLRVNKAWSLDDRFH